MEKCYDNEMSSTPMRCVSAGCFFFLSIVLAVYGIQVGPVQGAEGSRGSLHASVSLCIRSATLALMHALQMAQLDPTQCKRFLIEQPRTLGTLNCFLFLAFLSKGVYEVCTIMGEW